MRTRIVDARSPASTLLGRLLVQVGPGEAGEFVDLAATGAAGMILSGGTGALTARDLRRRGYKGALLMDRQRYRGAARATADAQFDPNWLNQQREAQVNCVLTDSGYVASGDIGGLGSVLDRTARISDAAAVLALANSWLQGADLRRLIDCTRGFTQPIALVIEHAGDPFSSRRILDGVLEFLDSGPPVIALCSDISALGLLANGAVAAGYGCRSSLRHLYPVRSGGGPKIDRPEAALWPTGMALHYVDGLYDAAMIDRGAPQWECACYLCNGLSVERLVTVPKLEVHQHNYAGLLERHRELAGAPADDRPRVWREWCDLAIERHNELTGTLRIPRSLRNWGSPQDPVAAARS
ncbi:MAG: hypothetical protein ACRDUS_10890 [Mycobacterium sp.]